MSLAAQLQAELKPLVDRILDLYKYGKPVSAVEPRSHLASFHPVTAPTFDALAKDGVEFFVICHDFWAARPFKDVPGNEKMFPMGSLVAERLQRAAITYNRCREAAVALMPALQIMYPGRSLLTEFLQCSFMNPC